MHSTGSQTIPTATASRMGDSSSVARLSYLPWPKGWSSGKRASRERPRELLDYLEIAHRADSLPATLSGGKQQRVAIAGRSPINRR